MRAIFADLLLVNGINGASIAVLTLNDVKDAVAVVLGVVSIISTLLIIRENLRKRKVNHRGTEATERKVDMGGIAIIVLLLLLGLLGSGCATLDKLYGREVQQLPGEPMQTHAILRTNVVVIKAAITNETGVITPAETAVVVTPEIAVQYAPATYVTNLVPRAEVETGIKAAGALPVPWAGTVALGLGWLYSAYASLRNKQVAKALVQSVQVGREFLQSTPEGEKLDAELKRLLARHQEYAGVAREVRSMLDTYVPAHQRDTTVRSPN